MSLPGSCIQRPVSVLMFYAGVLLFGFISLTFLKQELFPPITYPKLSVITNYENAAPEEIENLITKPIEEGVGSTAGIKSITSISREGISVVVAEFGWDQNMDFAALGIREKIDLIKARLPRDAQEPTVIKFNPFELPVLTLSVSSDVRRPVQLKRVTEKWFKDEIEKISGVASATLSGGEDEEILVAVDQGRLKASGVAVSEISKAIGAANLNYPGGTIKESFYEYLIRTMGEFKRIEEIGKVPIGKGASDDGEVSQKEKEEREASSELIFLQDLATIERTVQNRTSFSRFNGLENVTVSVQKQAHANTIRVVDSIKAKLKELEATMPADIKTEIVYNQAIFIKDAVNGVRDAAVQGGFLAFLVLLVFLRKALTATLVSIITPVTVLATFTLMYFMGISLNVISLGGIALGVGMLTDNAIVLIENAYRKFEESPDMEFKEQIRVASEEVIMPMFASTLTTVAVFLPMIFVKGIAGQIFKELAFVVIATQVISIILAFTLLPVLMVKFKVRGEPAGDRKKGWFSSVLATASRPINWIQNTFRLIVPAFMRNKGKYLSGVCLLFVFSMFALSKFDRVMMPKVDQGQFMIKIDMPVGARVEVTNSIAVTVEKYLATIPEIKNASTVVGSSKGASSKEAVQRIGSHQAQIIVNLHEKRKKSTDAIVQEIRADFETRLKKMLRGARITYFLYESAFAAGGEDSAPIVVNIQGNSMATLKSLAEQIGDKISPIPGLFDVGNSYPESSPETKININKDKASYYRFSVTDLATAAHISIRGVVATSFKEDGKEIPIRVVLREHDRDEISKLPFLLMRSPLGVDVPLADFVTFTIGRGPSEIKRITQERTVQVYAKIFGRSLKEATDDVIAVLSKIKVPEGYSVEIGGASVEMQESFNSLRMALILSVVLVYMIMAAQFESYFQPFIIMFCVPLALIGVAAALWITHTPISVVVLLGVILLGGIVVNNGIILIDFTNQMVQQGMPLAEAAIKASATRLRPILMTAFSSSLGLLPLAVAQDEGSKLQAPMGIAVMGGLLVSTFLTIVVIPSIYVGAMRVKERFGKRKQPIALKPT